MYVHIPGGADRFTVDTLTGDIQVSGRAPFEPDGTVFTLAVSAMCLGAAQRSETPAQLIYVQVGPKAPQFRHEPYVVAMSEYTLANDV